MCYTKAEERRRDRKHGKKVAGLNINLQLFDESVRVISWVHVCDISWNGDKVLNYFHDKLASEYCLRTVQYNFSLNVPACRWQTIVGYNG